MTSRDEELRDGERAFQALYGTWQPPTLTELGELMAGYRHPWWLAGGWALELATGSTRQHADLDLGVPRADVTRLTEHLAPLHFWTAYRFALTPLSQLDALPDEHDQMWVRKDASHPWMLDVLLTPTAGDEWVFKRDRTIRMPMSEAIRPGHIPYLAPHIVLLHKAHLCRPKDDADLEATLPHLTADERNWLASAIDQAVPDSPWLARVR